MQERSAISTAGADLDSAATSNTLAKASTTESDENREHKVVEKHEEGSNNGEDKQNALRNVSAFC